MNPQIARDYGNTPQDAAAGRMAEIPHEIECIERTLKGCYQGLDILNDRLSGTVARTEPPAATGNNKAASVSPVLQTPTARALQSITAQVADIAARIESLHLRLEV